MFKFDGNELRINAIMSREDDEAIREFFNAGAKFGARRERERIIALLETEKAYIAIAKESLILDGLDGLIALIKGDNIDD